MFGYFRFLNQYSNYRTQTAYKNYYCGLCFALELHYGTLSRMLLSYDVTILAIALHAHPAPQCDKLKCLGCRDCKETYFQNETWKKIAAINILLAAEKMRDDIHDERSLKATLGAFFYKNVIAKASRDYPQLCDAIRSGYAAIVAAEQQKQDVLQIGNLFADMMVSILDVTMSVPNAIRDYVRQISRWLYYIDALDDYDEDLKKGRFNPIAIKNLPFRKYLLTNYPQIQQHLSALYAEHRSLDIQLQDHSAENEILRSILRNSIPSVTSLILHQHELPELLHCRSENEWRADK